MSNLTKISLDINRFVDLFIKMAAIEWPKSTDWVPEKFKNMEIFEKYPNANPKKNI